LGQRVALDGTIAASIDIGLTRHDEGKKRRKGIAEVLLAESIGANNVAMYEIIGEREKKEGDDPKERRSNLRAGFKFGEMEEHRVWQICRLGSNLVKKWR